MITPVFFGSLDVNDAGDDSFLARSPEELPVRIAETVFLVSLPDNADVGCRLPIASLSESFLGVVGTFIAGSLNLEDGSSELFDGSLNESEHREDAMLSVGSSENMLVCDAGLWSGISVVITTSCSLWYVCLDCSDDVVAGEDAVSLVALEDGNDIGDSTGLIVTSLGCRENWVVTRLLAASLDVKVCGEEKDISDVAGLLKTPAEDGGYLVCISPECGDKALVVLNIIPLYGIFGAWNWSVLVSGRVGSKVGVLRVIFLGESPRETTGCAVLTASNAKLSRMRPLIRALSRREYAGRGGLPLLVV
jgi:hypothetical protein